MSVGGTLKALADSNLAQREPEHFGYNSLNQAGWLWGLISQPKAQQAL